MAQSPIKPKEQEQYAAADVIALVLSGLWVAMVGLFFVLLPPETTATDRFDSLRFVLILMAVFMPVAMIWVAAAASRSARIMREESTRLQAAIDGMRQTYMENRGNTGGIQPTVEKKLNEIAKATRKTETAVATFASQRPPVQKLQMTNARPPAGDDQPALALGTSAEDIAIPLPNGDLIRALNFPDNDQDTRGFDAQGPQCASIGAGGTRCFNAALARRHLYG